MRAHGFAKVNLSLHVGANAQGGLHDVRGLFLSVDWRDSLSLELADVDEITGREGSAVIDDWGNLAWRAASIVREESRSSRQMRLELHKRIPVAAGLGGGSADAAAALGLAGDIFGIGSADLASLAPALGSDVPFCFSGGLAMVSGTGERVDELEPASGFALALVVPPVEVSTKEVFEAWDRLDGPSGPPMSDRDLPPSLREHAPLANNLYAAAAAVAPDIDEWRAELSRRWGRPIVLTGSGPTLFAYFVDLAEAADALSDIPIGARATKAAVPTDRGWRLVASVESEV